MPMVEIDEDVLRQQQAVVAAVNKLMANPDARRKVLEARKVVEPDASIPEIDAAKPVMTQLEAMQKRQEEFEKKILDERAKEEADRHAKDLRSRWMDGRKVLESEGYDAEGVKKIEEYMEKNGIVDHEIGLAAWERKHPRPTPAPSHSGNIGMFDLLNPEKKDDKLDDAMKRLMSSGGEDSGALDSLVTSALADVRNPGARRVA